MMCGRITKETAYKECALVLFRMSGGSIRQHEELARLIVDEIFQAGIGESALGLSVDDFSYAYIQPACFKALGQTAYGRALRRLKAIANLQEAGGKDIESDHEAADRILCDLLRDIGYGCIADAFDEIDKWYS